MSGRPLLKSAVWLSRLLLLAVMLPFEGRAADVLPGQIIVKCRDDAPVGALARQALSTSVDVPRLSAALRDLTREWGIPLLLKEVTSGAEVLVAVDAKRLLRQLQARAEARWPAAATQLVERPGGSPLQPSQALSVRLPAQSPEARQLEQDPSSAAVLADALGRGWSVPITGTMSGDGTLTLAVDYAALLPRIRDRLQAHPDVQYAELNRMLGIPR